MNQTHIHLMLNHVAILGSIFSILILLAGIVYNSDILKKTAMIGFVIAALTAIPVFLTGEPAEESVEHLPGIIKETIHDHEEAAEISIWLIVLLGLASLVTFFIAQKNNSIKKGFVTFLLLASLVAAGSISYTGYLGGKIRHTELTPGGTPATNASTQGEEDDD